MVGSRLVARRLYESLTRAKDIDGVDVGEDVLKGELHVRANLVGGRGENGLIGRKERRKESNLSQGWGL